MYRGLRAFWKVDCTSAPTATEAVCGFCLRRPVAAACAIMIPGSPYLRSPRIYVPTSIPVVERGTSGNEHVHAAHML
jgi:hypothetical protein